MKKKEQHILFVILNRIFNKKFLIEKITEIIYALFLYDNWIEVITTFVLGSSQEEITLVLRNGYKITVKTYLIYWKRGGLKELSNVFLRRNYSRYELTIQKKDTVIILGAHVGVFTLYTASKLHETGKIIAIEPSPENFRLLKKNITQNHLKNAQAYRLAVASKIKMAKLYINESYYEHSLENRTDKFVLVKTITLNKIFADHKIDTCNFLKLDIEGAEWEVLDSLSAQNLHKIRQIAMEYHNSTNGEISTLEKKLKKDNFSVTIIASKDDKTTGYLYARRD